MKLLTLFTLVAIFVQDANARASKNAAKAVVKEEPRELSSGEMAAAGAVATALGVTLVHPIDTIKTLQQSNEGMGLNMLAASRKIMKVINYHIEIHLTKFQHEPQPCFPIFICFSRMVDLEHSTVVSVHMSLQMGVQVQLNLQRE